MKIVFLGTAHPYRGGIASFNEMLARQLSALGHEVEIITFTLQYPSFLFPGKTQYSDSPAPDDLAIDRMLNSIAPWSWVRTACEIKRRRPDMLFVRYWSPYLAPALGFVCRMVRKAGIEVVALADNIIPHERHFYDNMLTRYFIGSADRFVCMSRQVEGELAMFGSGKPVSFAPHPIYSNYGDPIDRTRACDLIGLDPSERYALFFGLIRDYKGLDHLLDAWADYKKHDGTNGKKLLVAGEFYADKAAYMQQIARLGIFDSVVIHDRFIPDAMVAAYFCASDMIVQPYKTATQSGVTQIAYHFGTPMIVTPVGGLPEIVPDGKVGYVVEKDRLPEAMERCFDAGINAILKANIAIEKERFSWRRMAETVISQPCCGHCG